MRVLVVTQYFWPESFAINELVTTLRDQGHSVVVATGKPNYPEGRVFEGYQAAGEQRETYSGSIPVVRVPLRPRGSGSALGLILNYASFAWSGVWRFNSLLAEYQVDAILVFAVSPITAAIPAIVLKWTKKAHLSIWIQDLWPETLAATGHVRNRALLGLVGLMVRAIYNRADTLLVQSRAFVEPVARYARRDKIVYYPSSIKLAGNQADGGALPPELSKALASHFCVVFAGNIGSVQAIPTVFQAAERLQHVAEVKIVLIGSGSMAAWAKARQQELNLANLLLVDRLPSSAMPAIYRGAGALLVTLNGQGVSLAYTVPLKVLDYLAAGRPIVASLKGEGARVVTESGAGLTCAPEDPAALASCIESVYRMPESERKQMGAAGRRFFDDQFEMTSQAKRLITILDERIGRKGTRS